jgi:rhodanese-related sulfurtransferase
MSADKLVKAKQTVLGLYATSAEAYAMWEASPETVNILDVRTLEEYILIGHAPMAVNIPLAIQTHDWVEEKSDFAWKPNPEFLDLVKKTFKPDTTLFVTCRSGGRSAMAINALANAGYKNLYNITDGFEGDTELDENNANYGKRFINGWKNSDLPWTYTLNQKQIIALSKTK